MQVSRNIKYQRVRVTTATVIAAGGNSLINITATPGYIARLKFVGAFSPIIPTATTGNNGIAVGIGSTAYGAEQLAAASGATGAAVTVKYDSSSNVSFDSAAPLQILFTNTTDKPTDGTSLRMYTVIYEEEAVGGGVG